jgi:hypothetical protein
MSCLTHRQECLCRHKGEKLEFRTIRFNEPESL